MQKIATDRCSELSDVLVLQTCFSLTLHSGNLTDISILVEAGL